MGVVSERQPPALGEEVSGIQYWLDGVKVLPETEDNLRGAADSENCSRGVLTPVGGRGF